VPDENEYVNEFTGKTVVVTGASSGIGLAAAEAFARGGARVGLVSRGSARLDQALAAVRDAATAGADAVHAYAADFTRFDDVRALATRLRDAYSRIDVLANNAGGAYGKRATTADGFEQTIQINHLSPFLLTNLLTDRLDGGRIINTSSMAHQMGRLNPDDLNSSGGYRRFPVYGASKLANILFTSEAVKRWPSIDSYCFHPGLIRTRFGNDNFVIRSFYRYWPILRTPAQGADTLVWLAAAPAYELVDGGYYIDRKLAQPAAPGLDADLATRLWDASERAVGRS
jgi:NAD(P)-dependent dehydrogenase (short-subunit alcohol dehydrogenase family)